MILTMFVWMLLVYYSMYNRELTAVACCLRCGVNLTIAVLKNLYFQNDNYF